MHSTDVRSHRVGALAAGCLLVALGGCTSPDVTAMEKLRARVEPLKNRIESRIQGMYALAYEGPILEWDDPLPLERGADGSIAQGMVAWTISFKQYPGAEGEIHAHKAYFTYRPKEGVWHFDRAEHRIALRKDAIGQFHPTPYVDDFQAGSHLRKDQRPQGKGTIDDPLTYVTTPELLEQLAKNSPATTYGNELLNDYVKVAK